jgi:hypothetical protein
MRKSKEKIKVELEVMGYPSAFVPERVMALDLNDEEIVAAIDHINSFMKFAKREVKTIHETIDRFYALDSNVNLDKLTVDRKKRELVSHIGSNTRSLNQSLASISRGFRYIFGKEILELLAS